jgi:hypothetical protein
MNQGQIDSNPPSVETSCISPTTLSGGIEVSHIIQITLRHGAAPIPRPPVVLRSQVVVLPVTTKLLQKLEMDAAELTASDDLSVSSFGRLMLSLNGIEDGLLPQTDTDANTLPRNQEISEEEALRRALEESLKDDTARAIHESEAEAEYQPSWMAAAQGGISEEEALRIALEQSMQWDEGAITEMDGSSAVLSSVEQFVDSQVVIVDDLSPSTLLSQSGPPWTSSFGDGLISSTGAPEEETSSCSENDRNLNMAVDTDTGIVGATEGSIAVFNLPDRVVPSGSIKPHIRTAVQSFQGKRPDELELNEGDLVLLVEVLKDGW